MGIIKTNNVPREVGVDLTPEERAAFDWVQGDEGFFRFHGEPYHLSQFERVPPGSQPGWDGVHPTSMTTGVLVRLVDGGEKVVVGTWCC